MTAAFGLLLFFSPLGAPWVRMSFDLPFLFRQDMDGQGVVLIYMDEASRRELKQPPGQPWDRRLHALLLDNLRAWGARGIVFMDDFNEATPHDESFGKAIAAAPGRVLLGVPSAPDSAGGTQVVARVAAPCDGLREAAPWGVFETGDGGQWRRRDSAGAAATPSLAWEAARWMPGTPPLGSAGDRWWNFHGKPGHLLGFGYADILNEQLVPEAFTNNVVFVGKPARSELRGGATGPDFHTPYTRRDGVRSPAVEVAATACLNLMRGDWLTRLAGWAEALVITGAGVALGLLLGGRSPMSATRMALGAALLAAGAGSWLMWRHHVWFAWLIPGAGQVPLALAWAVVETTQRARRELGTGSSSASDGASRRGSAVVLRVPHPGDGLASLPHEPVAPPPIPNHELLRRIGAGAYGEVWLARDEVGNYRAVKIVYRHSFGDAGPFDREYRGIQQYTPTSRTHHGLVQILDVGRNQSAGCFYYVMELGDCETGGRKIDPQTYIGRNLARDLDKRGAWPAREALALALELGEALEYLHSRQLIHRDIKPSNIIWVNGVPKFADVGLVTHAAERGQGRDTDYTGTEGFAAPEGPGTPTADVFSFGRVLYETVLGQPASQWPAWPATVEQRRDQAEVMSLFEIIRRACEPEPARRYANVRALQVDLIRLQDQWSGRKKR